MSKVRGLTPGRGKFFPHFFGRLVFVFALPYFSPIGWFQFSHVTEASQLCDIFLVQLFSWPHNKTPNLMVFWEI